MMNQTHFGAQNLPTNGQIGPRRARSTLVGCELALACEICTFDFEDSLLCSKLTLDFVLLDLVVLVLHISFFV